MRHALLLITALSLACGPSENSSTACKAGLALEGVTVIDGLGNDPKPEHTVVLCEGLIFAVGPTAEVSVPKGTKRASFAGKFVIPGLIDVHAHATVLAQPSVKPAASATPGGIDLESSRHLLRTLLAFGITTARNPAAPAEAGLALRESLANKEILGPALLTSGEALAMSALHGPFVATPNENAVRHEVDRQANLGVDFIKLYSTLPEKLVEVAIAEAHSRGLTVVGHLQKTTWSQAARLGINHITHSAPWSIEYLPHAARDGYRGTLKDRISWLEEVDFDGPEIQDLVAQLVASDVSIDPTLIASRTKFFGDDPRHTRHPELNLVPPAVLSSWQARTFTDDWTAEDFARGQASWPLLLAFIHKLHHAGVRLAAGSDTPNPWVIPGVGLHDELALLETAGITPLEVVKIATHNGAVALGLEDSRGSIEEGKRADLLVLAANPLQRLGNSRAIELVFLEGEAFSPRALLEAVGGNAP